MNRGLSANRVAARKRCAALARVVLSAERLVLSADAVRPGDRRDPRDRTQRLLLNLVLAGAAVAVALEFIHPVAYQVPELRATVETAMTLFALASAWFLRARFRYSRRLDDLLLLGAILTLGLTYLYSYVLPAALNLGSGYGFASAGLWGGLFVAGMFAAAALAPEDKLLDDDRRPVVVIATLSVAAVAVAALLAVLLRGALNTVSAPAALRIATDWRHPLVLVLVLAVTALFVQAAIAFARRARTQDDGDVAVHLAAAAILLAAAQFSLLALPWLSPTEISVGSGIRFLGVSVLLMSALRQGSHVQIMAAEAASTSERRRVARDLHDGLAQDLALIAAYGDRIAGELGAEHPVVVAARRALTVSRGTIAELSDPPGASAQQALEAVADELSRRFEIEIAVDVQLDRELAPDIRTDLSRIAREAIANAARHGQADNVLVTLKRSRGVVTMRVRDDGCGIGGRGQAACTEGFGLASIRERAADLGGSMTVRQPDKSGTLLEVSLP